MFGREKWSKGIEEEIDTKSKNRREGKKVREEERSK